MMRAVTIFAAAALATSVPAWAADDVPASLSCNARVIDGDTIECADERVRFYGVDTAERGKPGFREATEATRAMVTGVTTTCTKTQDKRDFYGRLVMRCGTDTVPDIGMKLICDGHAKRFTKYDRAGVYAKPSCGR